MGLVTLKFIQRCSPYQKGDIASFTPHHAEAYINAKRAILYVSDDEGDDSTKRRGRPPGSTNKAKAKTTTVKPVVESKPPEGGAE